MTPETTVTTESLRTLHRIQTQLGDLADRLARGPRLIAAHDANIQKLQKACDEAQGAADEVRKTNNDKQLRLSSNETALEKRQGQLRQASDNREYQALVDQIAADKMSNSVLADEILEGMEKYDELEAKVKEAQAAVDRARQEAEKNAAKVAEEKPRIEADIQRLKAELAEAEAALPGDFRQQYTRMVRQQGADALASLNGEYCTGCNQLVPVNFINSLMLGKPITCRSCGRMLYLPEGYEGH